MSVNTGINAAIALLENRHKDFKNIILTDPDFNSVSMSEIAVRLYKAADVCTGNRIKSVLRKCLTIVPKSEEECVSSFYEGIRAVEELFEQELIELER